MILIIVIAIYCALMLFVLIGFLMYPKDACSGGEEKKVTIIIPARNEEENIVQCINSITSQDYPRSLIQIILADDASDDATVEKATGVLKAGGIEYLISTVAQHCGKKESIRRAMNLATAEIIICRDADTFTKSDKWLRRIVNYITTTKKEFVICPVTVAHEKGFLSSLQETEMSVLTLFTISSTYFKVPFLCNGANLAFTKTLFYDTGAYKEHLHIASGDDIFFLENVKKKEGNKIGYLKNREAIVYTYAEKELPGLIDQKIRWSSKIFRNSNVINWLSAVIIVFTNIAWFWAIFYLFFDGQNLALSLFFILSKLLIDILLVFLASSFVKVKTGAFQVVLVGLIYPFYTFLIAVLSVLIKPKWKSN